MSAELTEGEKVGIKQGFANAGSWGIVRTIQNGEYQVAIKDSDDNVHTYIRTELRKWRSLNTSKSPESMPETRVDTKDYGSKGQLAQGQLPALRFDYVRLRSLNGDRMFVEVTFNGKLYLIAIEGLTYGTMADYVTNNKPEEVEYYEAQRRNKG